MFGDHLSLQSITAVFVIVVCIVNFIYLCREMDSNAMQMQKKTQVESKDHKKLF